ncbi:hypothetical protein EC991_003975 [Linnemannia zychae]|nr:hypothetical protein EC991_003975 [Linnemannia zychae]
MSDPELDEHSSVDVWADDNDADDDVWGNDDEVSYDRTIAQKEWDRLHENFGNTGYREGIEEGKEGTLQQGFNQGWAEGVQYGHELGRLRGLISPLLEFIRSSSSSSSTGPLNHIKDKDSWIGRASELVKELVDLDIAKVFDKAYFDDGLGPSSSSSPSNKTQQQQQLGKDKDGCCGGSGESSGSSCCQKKGEDADTETETTTGTEISSPVETSTQSRGCCSSSGAGEGSCQSGKKTSCKSKKDKSEEKAVLESEWSSKPEQVVSEYRSRVRALLLEANMEALSQTV